MSHEKRRADAAALRSRTMAAIPSERTSLEQLLARKMWASGMRGWRRHIRVEGAKPDFVFSRRKLAVFVDGCFWHACPECSKRPATNTDYWTKKLTRNAQRDARQTSTLVAAGWRVLRFWGHELQTTPEVCVERVQEALLA
jgi:DNA mismatch endonuclease (patch repair protein)